jgi:hypothetical protein
MSANLLGILSLLFSSYPFSITAAPAPVPEHQSSPKQCNPEPCANLPLFAGLRMGIQVVLDYGTSIG